LKLKKAVLKSVQVSLIGIIFYFLARGLLANWNQIKEYEWEFDYFLLGISFVLIILTYLVWVEIWRKLLKRSGHILNFKKMFKIWFLANLGKYLPGKVWSFLGMLYLLEKEGVAKSKGLSMAILAQALSVLSGLLVALLFLRYSYYQRFFAQSPGLTVVILLVLAGIMVLVFYPKLLEGIINLMLRILKKETITLNLKTKNILFILLLYCGSWFLSGFVFWVFIRSITPVSLGIYLSLTGAFAGSFSLGFLAFFAPGGIGVREGILVVLLSNFFPTPVAILISLLSRVWITLAEALCSVLALALER
jgi:uncharacterized membrane protein YbhN (UPF0104 family)